jgi:hypothetical protein
MNTKRFALGGFTHITDDEVLSRSNTVLQAMASSAFFPDPSPALADMTALFDDFKAKLAMSQKKGNPEDTVAKNDSRQRLEINLRQLALYVTKEANGNLQALLSSGFELSGFSKALVPPTVVRNVQLGEGRQSGQLRLDFDKQAQVLLYEYRYAQEANTPEQMVWTDPPLMTTSSRNNILAPLVPLTRYYVQVRAVNALGKSEWSDPVSYIGR